MRRRAEGTDVFAICVASISSKKLSAAVYTSELRFIRDTSISQFVASR
jgi:hypothetical protein